MNSSPCLIDVLLSLVSFILRRTWPLAVHGFKFFTSQEMLVRRLVTLSRRVPRARRRSAFAYRPGLRMNSACKRTQGRC